MAGLAEALLGATAGYAQSAQSTGLEKAKEARDRAFRDEGWAKEDERISNQRGYQAEQKAEERGYQSEQKAEERSYQEKKAGEQRKFASEEAEKERQFKASQKSKGTTGKLEIKQLEDGSVIATKGGSAFKLGETGRWVPIEFGTADDLIADVVDVEEEDAKKGFFSTAKDWVSGLLSSDESDSEVSPMAQAAAGKESKPAGNYDQVKEQVKSAYADGGFGAADKALRDNNLSQLQQVSLLFDLGISSIPERENIGTADATRAGQNPQAIQSMLEGTGVNLSEFVKVKNAYPDRSDKDIIKAVQDYNQSRSRNTPQ